MSHDAETPTAFGRTIVPTTQFEAAIRTARGHGRTGNGVRRLWRDKDGGVDVSVAEFAVQKDNNEPRVTTAVSNLGHDKLMALRRRAHGRRSPLTDKQRRELAAKRDNDRTEQRLDGTRSAQDRLEAALAAAGPDPALRRRIMAAFDAETAPPAATSPADLLAASKARVTLCDLDWFFAKLTEIKMAIDDGVIGAEVGAQQRMAAIKEFDIDTVSSRDMLDAVTAGLVAKRRLLTPQEREQLLSRIPVEAAPEEPVATSTAPPAPATTTVPAGA